VCSSDLACLQHKDDGRIIATSAPTTDSDAFFDLDAPNIRRSWPTATAGTMASTTAGTNGRSSAIAVDNRRACLRQVNTLLWGKPVSPGDLGNDRARYQRLPNDPGTNDGVPSP